MRGYIDIKLIISTQTHSPCVTTCAKVWMLEGAMKGDGSKAKVLMWINGLCGNEDLLTQRRALW